MEKALLTGKEVKFNRVKKSGTRLVRPSFTGQEIIYLMPNSVYDFVKYAPWWSLSETYEKGNLLYPSAHFVGLYDNLIFLNGYNKLFKWGKVSYFRYIAIFYFYLVDIILQEENQGKSNEVRDWIDSLNEQQLWTFDRYLRSIIQADELNNIEEYKGWVSSDFRKFFFVQEDKDFACMSVRLASVTVFGLLRASRSFDVYNTERRGLNESIEFLEEEGLLLNHMTGFYLTLGVLPSLKEDSQHEKSIGVGTVARRFDNPSINWARIRDWDSGFRYLYEFRDELHVRYRALFLEYLQKYIEVFCGNWFKFLSLVVNELAPKGSRYHPLFLYKWDIDNLKCFFYIQNYVKEFVDVFKAQFNSDVWDFFCNGEFGSDFEEVSRVSGQTDLCSTLSLCSVLSEETSVPSKVYYKFKSILLDPEFNEIDSSKLEEIFLCSAVLENKELEKCFEKAIAMPLNVSPMAGRTGRSDELYYANLITENLVKKWLNSPFFFELAGKKSEFSRLAHRKERDELLLKLAAKDNSFLFQYFLRLLNSKAIKRLVGEHKWAPIDFLIVARRYRETFLVKIASQYDWFIGQLLNSSGTVSPYKGFANNFRSYFGGEKSAITEDTGFDNEVISFEENHTNTEEIEEERYFYSQLSPIEREYYASSFNFDKGSRHPFMLIFTDATSMSFFESEILTDDFMLGRRKLLKEEELWGFEWFFPSKERFMEYSTNLKVRKLKEKKENLLSKSILNRVEKLMSKDIFTPDSFSLYNSKVKRLLTGKEKFSVEFLYNTRTLVCMLCLPFLFFFEWLNVLEKWVEVRLNSIKKILVWFSVSFGFIIIFFPQSIILFCMTAVWFLWNFTLGIFRKLFLYPFFSLSKLFFRRSQSKNSEFFQFSLRLFFRDALLFLFVYFFLVPSFYEVGSFVTDLSMHAVFYGISPLLLVTFLGSTAVLLFLLIISTVWRRFFSGLFIFVLMLSYLLHKVHFMESAGSWSSPYLFPQNWRVSAYEGALRPRVGLRAAEWPEILPEVNLSKIELRNLTKGDKKQIVEAFNEKNRQELRNVNANFERLFQNYIVDWNWGNLIGYQISPTWMHIKENTFYREGALEDPEVQRDTLYLKRWFTPVESPSKGPIYLRDDMYIVWYYPPHADIEIFTKTEVHKVNEGKGMDEYEARPTFHKFLPKIEDWDVLSEKQIVRGLFHLKNQYDFMDVFYFGLPGMAQPSKYYISSVVRDRTLADANLFHKGHFSFFRGIFREYPFLIFDLGLKSEEECFADKKGFYSGCRSLVFYGENTKLVIGLNYGNQFTFDHYTFFVPNDQYLFELDYMRGFLVEPLWHTVRTEGSYFPQKNSQPYRNCNHIYSCYLF